VRERSQSIQAINYIKVSGGVSVTVHGVGPAELPRRRAALAPARVPAPVRLVPSARRRLAALAPAVGRPLEAQVVQRRALAVRQRAQGHAAVHRRRVVPRLCIWLEVRRHLAGPGRGVVPR
jgi:hypothetical protein